MDHAFNPNFTFDTFVVGPSNRFAHATARAVSERPSQSFDLLFLHGGSGVGKTHLLHAVAQVLVAERERLHVVLKTSEQFTHEMVSCLRADRMSRFWEHYRSADVLLIDDVPFFGHKGHTQEEFTHTLNELQNHGKQVVLASDAAPQEIPGLVARLRSRFEGALIIAIEPTDIETKMAILAHKAMARGMALPDEVREWVALRTRSSVRQLEGALARLQAHASLEGIEITLRLAERALADIAPRSRRVGIEAIQNTVAEQWGIPKAHVKSGSSHTRHVTDAQHVAIYLARELSEASLPAIGRAFGGKHHTSIMYAVAKIQAARQKDPDLDRVIRQLIDKLQR